MDGPEDERHGLDAGQATGDDGGDRQQGGQNGNQDGRRAERRCLIGADDDHGQENHHRQRDQLVDVQEEAAVGTAGSMEPVARAKDDEEDTNRTRDL